MQTSLAISAVVLLLSASVSVQTVIKCSKEAARVQWTSGRLLGRKQSRHNRVALQGRLMFFGKHFAQVDQTSRAEGVLRGRFPSTAETHRQIRGSAYPRLWRYRDQHGLLYIFLHKGRRNQITPRRYSLTYVKEGNDCKIVDHEASAMPAPPPK